VEQASIRARSGRLIGHDDVPHTRRGESEGASLDYDSTLRLEAAFGSGGADAERAAGNGRLRHDQVPESLALIRGAIAITEGRDRSRIRRAHARA